MLEIENVSFSYQDGTQRKNVLDDISANFERGVFYTILGESGSGKTTLLSMLSALDVPEKGRILCDGRDIQKTGLQKYRRNEIGIVFQNFHLIPYMSGLQNVLVAMSITDNVVGGTQRALEILEDLGITERMARRPVTQLSGGEQQRVAIARALATDIDIMLADEPTGNLDSKTQQEIISVFKILAHEYNKCVIVVTHSNDVSRGSDKVYRMEAGRLVEG